MTDKTDSTEMAQDRTDWAEDRTILANERTFAGWMRTGMACVGLALGLKAVFGDFEPTWVAKAAAEVFIVIGIFIFWTARVKCKATLDRLSDHAAEAIPTGSMTVVATILTLGAGMTGVILWLL